MSTEAALRQYTRRGHKLVDGWLEPVAIDLVTAISAAQVRRGVTGGCAEIGIHHGRLFILLHLLSQADERSAAYDLFEMQDENIDGSGHGDKETFLANLREHRCDGSRIVVKSRNSLRMTPDEIRADVGPVRMFSVDGGHTADITASDLALAEQSLCPGGVIVLDDFFNEAWPGVCEGAARYVASPASGLVPVGIGGNKFVFTNSAESAGSYRAALLGLNVYQFNIKMESAFGKPVVIVEARTQTVTTRLASTKIWSGIKGTATGQALKAAVRRVLPDRR